MALTFRDVDNKLARFPGATTVAVSRANYIVLLGLTEPNATVPTHKKHIEYVPRASTPAASPTRIIADPHVLSDDIYVLA